MESNTPLLNTSLRAATGRNNIRAKNTLLARGKTRKNWKNMLFGWMKNSNAASTISGSEAELVYNSNNNSIRSDISVNSVTSPISYSPKSVNTMNEELQLRPGNLSKPNIPLNAIKEKAVKKWLEAHPGEWKRITQLWEQEKLNKGLDAHATLPPKFVQAKVLEMMLNQSGGYSRRRRRRARKSRRSNRK